MTDLAADFRLRTNVIEPGARTAPILTRRQKECLSWVEQGKSSADIATILGLSSETVNEHVGEACRRLGVRTRIQAVVTARARGFFGPASLLT